MYHLGHPASLWGALESGPIGALFLFIMPSQPSSVAAFIDVGFLTSPMISARGSFASIGMTVPLIRETIATSRSGAISMPSLQLRASSSGWAISRRSNRAGSTPRGKLWTRAVLMRISSASTSRCGPRFVKRAFNTRVTLDLVRLAQRRVYDTALLLAGDRDLAEPVRLAQDEGALVTLVAPLRAGIASELRQLVDLHVKLDTGDLRTMLNVREPDTEEPVNR